MKLAGRSDYGCSYAVMTVLREEVNIVQWRKGKREMEGSATSVFTRFI